MKVIIISVLLVFTLWAAETKILYGAPYGTKKGEIGYFLSSPSSEAWAVPQSFYVDSNSIFIADCHNDRLLEISYGAGSQKRLVGSGCMELNYVNLRDSILINNWYLCRIRKENAIRKVTRFVDNTREDFKYHVHLGDEYHLIVTTSARRFVDGQLRVVEKQALPGTIEVGRSVYLVDKSVVVAFGISTLREELERLWNRIGGSGDPPPDNLFGFPDSSEWGQYFTKARPDESMGYLGVDREYNTYWSTGRQSPEDTANSYVSVFSYDKQGKLRFWFPEPTLESGWKHYLGGIVVNSEGRIFQMSFYSKFHDFENHREKTNVDPEKGIRILEYLPGKEDFTHEGRVKLYGSKSQQRGRTKQTGSGDTNAVEPVEPGRLRGSTPQRDTIGHETCEDTFPVPWPSW